MGRMTLCLIVALAACDSEPVADLPDAAAIAHADATAADTSVHGVEICDGTDNDGDGATDEDDAVDATRWYRDADGDGWGDDADTKRACAAPPGYVERGGDCDDDLAARHPDVVASATALGPTVAFDWVGQSDLVAVVDVEVEEIGCSDLAAESNVAWLHPVLDVAGGRVVLFLERAHIVGGVATATVAIVDSVDGRALDRFAVGLRALGSADPSDPPKVLVIGLDGVRSDAFDLASTPTFDRLTEHAAWTLDASTQRRAPTVSGPGWTSIVTGVDANKHRIVANGGWALRDQQYPSFLSRARSALGLSTAVAVAWAPILEDILEPDAADVGATGSDSAVVDTMRRWLATGDADLHFVHIDAVDHAGHDTGFSPANPAYLSAIEAADRWAQQMIDAVLARTTIAGEQWMVVVTTDHGGAGTSHGALDEANRRIPLIVAGPSVFAGPINAGSHLDVHPTVLDFLGLPPDPGWALDGKVVGEPYEADCDDGSDNDGDGQVDCDDPDCAGEFTCHCPQTDLGGAEGLAVAAGTLAGADDDLAGTCGGSGGADSTFAWTAQRDDTYTFDLTGSARNHDTVLYVRDATCGGRELACDDDSSAVQSAVQVELQSGETVVLVVDTKSSPDTFQLNVEALSACPDVDLGVRTGDAVATGTVASTGATFFASCARSGRDALIVWTATVGGSYTIDTNGSAYDTVLHVRDGRCAGAEIACDDDGGDGYLSEVTLELAAGQTVTIVVSGFNARPEGPGSLPRFGEPNYVLNIHRGR